MRAFIMAALALIVCEPTRAQEIDITKGDEGNQPVIVHIPWNMNRLRTYRVNQPITSRNPVSIKVTHFNHVLYDLVFSVETQTQAEDSVVRRLWTQFAAPMANFAPGDPLEFTPRLTTWRQLIAAATKEFNDTLNTVPTTVELTNEAIARLAKQKEAVAVLAQKLNVAKSAAYDAILVPETIPAQEIYYRQAVYDSELKRHEQLMTRLDAFMSAAGRTASGFTRLLDQHPAGTGVTVTIAVKPRESSRDQEAIAAAQGVTTVSYMVTSERRVRVHTGPVYTNIEDVEFEKVELRSGGEAFQRISKPRSGADVGAFLTYELTDPVADAGFGLTVGVSPQNLSKRLYGGVSARLYNRVFISGGAYTKELREGVDPLSDNIYQTLRNIRELGWFLSISTNPF